MSDTPAMSASGLPGKRVEPYRAGMTITPLMPEGDSTLLKRLAIVVILGLLFVVAFVHLNSVYSRKFLDVTGRAAWIWPPIELSRELPVAFFAMRDFELPAARYYTKIKVAGHPEYTLFFNGQEIAGRRIHDDHALDVYDVSELAKTGRNRIVVAVRSANGVGGLIAAVDIGPEVANYVVSGRDWSVAREWYPDIITRTPRTAEPPMLLGEPPAGRWNYLQPKPAESTAKPTKVVAPKRAFDFITAIPQVKIVGGVAIVTSRRVRAHAFDFGEGVEGRVRITRKTVRPFTQAVQVRFANLTQELDMVEVELRPVVFAGNERTVLDPEVRQFRYVLVYGEQASVELLH